MKILIISLSTVLWFGLSSHAFAQTPQPSSKTSDKPEASGSEPASSPVFSFNARLRPRLVLRDNHAFGLPEDERNYNRGDNQDLGTLQARLGTGISYGKLSAEFLLQYAGRNGLTGGNQLTDPTLGIHVAFAKWQALEQLAIQLGRFEMSYGAQRVIGSVGYHQVGRAFDGAIVLFKPSKTIAVDLFATKYIDELLPERGVFDGDAFFTGLYATYSGKWSDTVAIFDAYALYDQHRRADGDGLQRNLITLGARAKGSLSLMDLEVEGAFQPGTMCVQDMNGCTDMDIDISAWFFDTELGVGVKKPNKLRGFVGFGMASGDDPDTTGTFEGYNHLYPTAHKFLGRMDIIGPRTNIQEIRAGFNWEAWIAHGSLVYHDFSRLMPESERSGGELDLTVWFHIIEGLKFEAVYGLFLPDEGLSNSDTSPEGVAHWTSLTAVASF